MKPKHGLPENRFLFFLELVPVIAIFVGIVIVMAGDYGWVGWSLIVAGVMVNLVKRHLRLKKRRT
jgi:hypothetical protein